MNKAISSILALVLSIITSVFIVTSIHSCNSKIQGTLGLSDKRADKCINGYIWKSNFKNTMYYQYIKDGTPIKCFVLKNNKRNIK